jgi:PA14 domain
MSIQHFASLVAAVAVISLTPVASAVEVTIYAGHTEVGGGAPFTDPVGTFSAPAVDFATATGYAWHPFGLPHFGAVITGCIRVAADGTYTFVLDSDDGSLLFIDSGLVVDNGGPHGPLVASGAVALTAGEHHFRIEFFEDFGGPSGVDLHLPHGVEYTRCPDGGASAGMMMFGLCGLFGLRRMIRK